MYVLKILALALTCVRENGEQEKEYSTVEVGRALKSRARSEPELLPSSRAEAELMTTAGRACFEP